MWRALAGIAILVILMYNIGMDDNSQKIADLQRQINEIKAVGAASRYLGNNERKVLEDVSDDAFLRIFWDKFYYYNTFFEGIDGFNIVNSVTIDGGGAFVNSPGSGAGAFSAIFVDPGLFLGGFSFTKESRLRISARFSTNTNQDMFLSVGSVTVAGEDGYGFWLEDGTLKGFAQTAPGTRTSVTLKTITTGVNYTLDARFYPGYKVEFFVDGAPLGTVSATLPTTTGNTIWQIYVEEQEAVQKGVFIGSVEYLQKRL